jgi:hypothetical protein
MFDSTDLTWRLSENKLFKAKVSVKNALEKPTTTLKEWQRLMGRLNDISQMCPFMKLFKSEINKCVATIASDAPAATVVTVSQQAKKDLQIWAGYLNSDFKWLPICRELWTPPIWHKEFVSDAAGLTENAGTDTRPGCGNVGFREDGTIILLIN